MNAEQETNMPEPEGVEAAASAEAPEAAEPQQSEEKSVIDVHVPHGGLHTWKDFWIHLGTITLGLLIAISLEQSVEWLHHLHQRHQLEADLRAEAEKNLAIMDDDYRYCDLEMAYLAANRERVDTMRASHGRTRLAYLPFNETNATGVILTAPLASVWTTAKESESVALLPREEARFYDRVYRQHDMYMTVSDRRADIGREMTAFGAQFAATPKNPWDPIYPDLSRMSAEQLDQYSALLTGMWVATDGLRSRLDYFYAAETAVLQGKTSDMHFHLVHHPVTLPPAQPDATAAEPSMSKPEKP